MICDVSFSSKMFSSRYLGLLSFLSCWQHARGFPGMCLFEHQHLATGPAGLLIYTQVMY
uniref:Family 69 glycosyltransferase n=1 Tax=Phakopsora pachyrhizi TaxID=170000 RepID=A0A0S1MIH2_PHAPC